VKALLLLMKPLKVNMSMDKEHKLDFSFNDKAVPEDIKRL
jgi:hypothetical protein